MARERRSRFANAVVVLTDDDAASRFGDWIESLLVGLVDEGLNPLLVASEGLRIAASIPERAIGRLPLPQTRWSLLRKLSSRPLAEQLANEPVRLVLSMTGRLASYGNWLADRLNVPLATVVTGTDEVGGSLASLDRLAVVFAASGALADAARAGLGEQAGDRVVPVSLGVHLGSRTSAFSDSQRIPSVVAYGPLEPRNNFDEFIVACSHLAERKYEAVFFIVGTGSAEQHLRQLARQRGLADRLTFVPEPRRMDDIFDGIDIFVQPHVCQRMDLRLLNAMAAGVVVLARNGGAVDFVRDGVNGVELTNADESTLVMLLARLLDEPGIGRRIGDSARQYVHANHLAGVTVQSMVDRIRQFAVRQQTIPIR